MYIKPFSTELLRKKKKKEMTCNFRFLRGCFACPASLNQMIRSHEKRIIAINHKHNLFIFPFGKDYLFSQCDRYR